MIVNELTSINKMLEEIDINNTRIVFLINDKNQLTGCISQGDIIRALIGGASLKLASKDIAKLNPLTVFEQDNAFEIAKEKLLDNKIHAIPIIDKERKIISVVTLLDVLTNITN